MTFDEDDLRLPDDEDDRVGWAYKVADDAHRTELRFDAWAEHYDEDVRKLLDWRGPGETVKVTLKHVERDAVILDAGSGTGLVGEVLAAQGYAGFVGVDISQHMLDIAEKKDIYAGLVHANLMEPLDFPDSHFDATLSVGTSGYLSGRVIREFARVTKPGGHIIYTISDHRYDEGGFAAAVDHLKRAGIMDLIEKSDPFAAIPRAEPDHLARVHVLKLRKGS